MTEKSIGNYRDRIEECTEEIEDYKYIDVDYVDEILDEIGDKLDETDDLADIPDTIDNALDEVIAIITAMSEYVANNEVPAKLGALFVDVREHVASIKDNLEEILQVVDSVNDVIGDLQLDFRS